MGNTSTTTKSNNNEIELKNKKTSLIDELKKDVSLKIYKNDANEEYCEYKAIEGKRGIDMTDYFDVDIYFKVMNEMIVNNKIDLSFIDLGNTPLFDMDPFMRYKFLARYIIQHYMV